MNGSVFGVKYKFPFKLYLTYNVLVKNGYWWDTSLQFDIGELLLGGPVGELSIIPGSIKKFSILIIDISLSSMQTVLLRR